MYNGKEYNEEIGWYDYGKRYFDPSIARWGQIDPESEKYTPWSPYNYVLNNPIGNIDPQGDTVWAYTERVMHEIGNTGIQVQVGRHTFLRVKTDSQDKIVELWGPAEGQKTGRPRIDDYGGNFGGRIDVFPLVVNRPEGVPEGDYSFENQILEDAQLFQVEGADQEGRTPNYINLPDYNATGPNSNGFVNALVKNAGGEITSIIWNVWAINKTAEYDKVINENRCEDDEN